MNSDNSQQPLDNWVQKRVRNLEGMNRARHVSADQGDAEKPNKNYLSSKRSSAPVSIVVICTLLCMSYAKCPTQSHMA